MATKQMKITKQYIFLQINSEGGEETEIVKLIEAVNEMVLAKIWEGRNKDQSELGKTDRSQRSTTVCGLQHALCT